MGWRRKKERRKRRGRRRIRVLQVVEGPWTGGDVRRWFRKDHKTNAIFLEEELGGEEFLISLCPVEKGGDLNGHFVSLGFLFPFLSSEFVFCTLWERGQWDRFRLILCFFFSPLSRLNLRFNCNKDWPSNSKVKKKKHLFQKWKNLSPTQKKHQSENIS